MSSASAVRTNPYRGLPPFEEEDSDRFFGRDRETEELLERLAARRMVAVIGVSGCGKSSLVRAGVRPILRLGAADRMPGDWRIVTMQPGAGPIANLRHALGAGSDWPATSFGLTDWAAASLTAGENLLLVVDQFEEIFRFREQSLEKDGGNEAALFINLLLNAADQRDWPVYLLLTMRTDYLGECAQFRGLPEALNDRYYLVPRMTRRQQQEAIERPLDDVRIHPGLVQRLLNDCADNPDHLPVLQHLLKRLWEEWERTGADGPIDFQHYDATGKWQNTLANDADSVAARFPAEQLGIRRLFQAITDMGAGERPVRRPLPLADLERITGLSDERLRAVIDAFQERGFLRRGVGDLVDLTHESVMWCWPALNQWIAEEADDSSRLRFFSQSAVGQVQLTGSALREGLAVRERVRSSPAWAERYLKPQEIQSMTEWISQSERSRRRRKWMMRAGIAAVVGLAMLVAWAIRLRQDRAEAAARELSAWAAFSVTEDPERSLALGMYAHQSGGSLASGLEAVLHDALLRSHVRQTLRSDSGFPLSMDWSPDGKRLLAGSEDKTARIWEIDGGRQPLTLRGHGSRVWKAVWSPDGSRIATASEDGTAKIWDSATGRELRTLKGHTKGFVMGVAWSRDGNRLLTAGEDKTARIWDAATGTELGAALSGHKSFVLDAAFSPDGALAATCSWDNTAMVWDVATRKPVATLKGHGDRVWRLAWSPDGKRLATASWDKTVKLWDAATWRETGILAGHWNYVQAVAWSADGTRLATASQDMTARIWDAATGREVANLRGHSSWLRGVAWSPDGVRLATASQDKTARIWDAAETEVATLRNGPGLRSVAWSPDGTKAVTGGRDLTVRIWDASSTGAPLRTLQNVPGRDVVLRVAWSPDGARIAAATSDRGAKVWDAVSGRELLTFTGHGKKVLRTIAWAPDSRRIASGADDGSVIVWDALTGQEQQRHKASGRTAAWSPDGTRLAIGNADFSVVVREASSGKELLMLKGHTTFVNAVAWSADGRKIATASGDQSARIWEAATGRELHLLAGHQSPVQSIAWSMDGTRVATAAGEQPLKIWDAAAGVELFSIRGHENVLSEVAWSPDGRHLASAGEDGVVQIYAASATELLKLVRSRITRELEPGECRRYLGMARCPSLPGSN